MIAGFNIAQMAQIPPPFCATSDDADYSGFVDEFVVECLCSPRVRFPITAVEKVKPNSTIKIADGSYTFVGCGEPYTPYWGGVHPTTLDVIVTPFIYKGDVYLKMSGGRTGREFGVELIVTDSIGNITTVTKNLEII